MKHKRIISFLLSGLMLFSLCGYFPTKNESLDLLFTANAASYNPSLATEYAEKYWDNYNKNYSNYNSIGGDCANFVSQCLVAGGLSMTDGWYWKSYDNRSASWSYCPSMYTYFKGKGYEIIANPSASQISEGNPILYSWDGEIWGHAAICIGRNKNNIPIVAAHNTDYNGTDWKMGAKKICTIVIPSFKTNTVKINYHTNGGTIGNDEYYAKDGKIYNSEDKVVGEKWEYGKGDSSGLFNASTFKLTKKGYTFTGWSTSKSGGTVFDPDDTSLTANDIFPDIATKSGTVVLYAQWKKNTVTINYNTNGGTISSDTYYSAENGDIYKTSTKKKIAPKWDYESGSEDGLYNASTFGLSRKGYTFLGWSTVKSGGKIYDQKDASLTANDIFPDITTKSGTVMMYAQWGGKEMKETEGAGQKIPDGDYWIVNALNSRYAVDISGDNYDTTKGTNLKMHMWGSDNFGKYDVFTVKYLNNGFYSITQRTTNMCIDVYGGELLAGTNVQMYTSNGTTAQQWSIKETDNGYTIQSRCNGFYLDVEGGSTENANLQVYPGNNSKSQLFSFIPYNSGQPVKDGVYRIGTVNGKGAYIDAAGEPGEYKNKTNLQIWDAGADNYFKFEYSGNGFYKIYDNESGLAVDVDNSSQRNYLTREANVQLYESKDTPGQYWAIKSDGEGYYYLISKLNGYYLDLNKGIITNGNNIHMWSATNGKTQKWSLVNNKKLVVTPPLKTTYNVGENIDLSGMTVKMVFSDGYEWDVTKYVNVSCDLNTTGVKNATVTYKNGGFTNKATFEVNVKANEKIIGDVNVDGEFNIADAVLLQKWLLGSDNKDSINLNNADLYADGRIDVFDLILMREKLVA